MIAVYIETELGLEKQCLTCGQYWPADGDFFDKQRSARDQLAARCIACVREKIWAFPTVVRARY